MQIKLRNSRKHCRNHLPSIGLKLMKTDKCIASEIRFGELLASSELNRELAGRLKQSAYYIISSGRILNPTCSITVP